MASNSFVSVIIIFLNAEDFLTEAVESVLSQTHSNWELLLVDDGSSDRSSEIARSYAARQPGRILFLEHEAHQNLGMSASRNLGIRKANGRYIAFLDADDYWLPTKLATHASILDAQPNVGMLYGSTRYWFSWTGRPEDSKRDYIPEQRVRTDTLFYPPHLLPLLVEGRVEVPSTCSILVRSEVVRSVSGFEESFRGMYEDQAFYVKVCLSTQVLATNDCLAWYRQHPKSNYSTAKQSGKVHDLHYHFLKWLETYCREQNVTDAQLLQTIRRQLWLYGNPSSSGAHVSSHLYQRRIKKWILRLEKLVLPASIRSKLWIRN